MITLTSANYEDPHQSPNCSLLLRLNCEPHPTNGETALDNAQVFVERVKLIVGTPLDHGPLARDSDGYLLASATLAYLIRCAEQRGADSVKQRLAKKRVRKPAANRSKRTAKSRK